MIDSLYDKMEQNLEFLAVTGVEDKLQVDVADTIQKIKEASINFWVLTGDKEETAISIGNAIKVYKNISKTLYEYLNLRLQEMKNQQLKYKYLSQLKVHKNNNKHK